MPEVSAGQGPYSILPPQGLERRETELVSGMLSPEHPSLAREADAPAVEEINHPQHYGGADNPYEVIKVIEAWGLDFALGNSVKYIARAGHKTVDKLTDLRKARWYLDHEIERLSKSTAPPRSTGGQQPLSEAAEPPEP